MTALDDQQGGDHYRKFEIQPVEYILANNIGFLAGNVIKYATRYKDKGGAEDIKKIIHYCQLILEFEYPPTTRVEGMRRALLNPMPVAQGPNGGVSSPTQEAQNAGSQRSTAKSDVCSESGPLNARHTRLCGCGLYIGHPGACELTIAQRKVADDAIDG